MAESRLNNTHIVIGRPGEGKSYLIENEIIKKTRLPKTLIYDINGEYGRAGYKSINYKGLPKWDKGIRTIFDPDFLQFVKRIEDDIYNTLMILEDSTAYIDSYVPPEVKRFMSQRRHRNIDLVFTYHAFHLVQPKIFSLATHLTIFKTDENIEYAKSKIPNYPLIKRAFDKVKAAPAGTHFSITLQLGG